jgi:hypothetical protein
MFQQSKMMQPKMINLIWFKKSLLGRKEIEMAEEMAVKYDAMCAERNTDALQIDYQETVDDKIGKEKKGLFG